MLDVAASNTRNDIQGLSATNMLNPTILTAFNQALRHFTNVYLTRVDNRTTLSFHAPCHEPGALSTFRRLYWVLVSMWLNLLLSSLGYPTHRRTRPSLAQNYPCATREHGTDHRARDIFYWRCEYPNIKPESKTLLWCCGNINKWQLYSLFRPCARPWQILTLNDSLIKKCCSDLEALVGWVVLFKALI